MVVKDKKMAKSTTFSRLIKEERAKLGLSNRAFGEVVGVSGRLISYYEAGRRTPTIDTADKILKALGKKMELGE